MPPFSITFARSARKELEALPRQIASRVLDKIAKLATTPRPAGSLKLKGDDNLWRIRIGDYRAIYKIDDIARSIDISVIRHRKDVYRDI